MRSELFLQTPSWFILICILAGAGYAVLLYRTKSSWGKYANYGLAGLRGIAVSIICFLLLSPLVKKTETSVDKAKVVFAIDNSESMKVYGDGLKKEMAAAAEKLSDAGYEVGIEKLGADGSLSGPVDSISFNQKKTDLSGLLQSVKSNFEGRNLTDVILLSDGIVNQGVSPVFNQYPFKVSTLAVGDTVPKLDIRVKDVIHNRIAYLGNDFPIRVEVVANGLAGKKTTVSLKQGGRVIGSQPVIIGSNTYFGVFEFVTSSQQKGVQHYTVELGAVQGENSAGNNRRNLYIDMIDGRQKVLILAYTPHPDIKALRSILEKNDNYQVDVNVLTVSQNPGQVQAKPYDLVILHQIPNTAGLGNGMVKQFSESNTPLFYILGNQSAVPLVNAQSKTLMISSGKGQVDKVVARYNPSFQLLNFSEEALKLLEKLPPLSVPFGEYAVTPGTESVLYQTIGRLSTSKPLLALNTSINQKTAVLAGEGIWQWRQEEFALTGKQEIVDDLFQKMVQLLSLRNDKRKFRVYPTRSEFEAGEQAVFQTEIYNDIYEPIFGQEVKLEIVSEKGKKTNYVYTHTAENQRFAVSGLSDGVYRFQASTTLRSGAETVSGQFVVRDVDLEMNHTTADFAMLRELAGKTGGRFIRSDGLQDFVKTLVESKPANRLDSTEEMVELIHLKWIFILLVLLMGLEWGTRKYLGGY